ncbi:hypothetical protein [Nocardioides conyzicola]|uniref:Uncharacterized protein n=1 Tax=Nocardioides conyzicola TaxID=1651781 RepID=A0ABP8XEC2_9ACTN
MRLADVLLLGVVGVLVSYGALALVAFRRTRDPATTLALAFAAYWTLVGGVYFLHAKRTAGGATYTYLEDRLFPVTIDGDYALTLLAYSVFLFVCIGTFIALSRAYRSGGDEALSAWERLSQRFVHWRLLVLLILLTAAKLLVVRSLIAANADGASLYEATRTVKGGSGHELLVYQYLNISTSYAMATGFALWLGFVSGRASYRPAHRIVIWTCYLVLLAEVVGENAVLGNRAVPLVVLAGVAAGWARWRYVPSTGRARTRLTVMLVGLGTAALLGLGAIGNARGGGLTTPGTIATSILDNLKNPANVLTQVGNSAEKVAAHMSLLGVIRDGPGLREPFAANSYAVYATLVNAPPDQVFTIHPVAAWWLRVGPVGVVLAGLLIGVVLAFFQRLSFRPRGAVLSAFALPAAVLPAAGIPTIMLRSGPETTRSVVIELLIIPALLCLPATLFGRTPVGVVTAAHQAVPPRSSGVSTMTTPLTNDVARAFAAIRRRWWIVAAAAVLGAAIGFAGASSDDTATYDSNVAMPPATSTDATWTAPTTRIAADLHSSQTQAKLGAVVDGTTLVTTGTPEPAASVDIRVTAPTAERAAAATAAYAQEAASQYDAYIRELAEGRIRSIEQGIEAIGQGSGDRSVATRADLAVQKSTVQQLIDRKTPVTTPDALTSGGSTLQTVVLLTIAFAGLAAALVGFLGLGSRTLRFTDDVTDVTGDGSLVASVTGDGSWAMGSLVDRLAADSGQSVTLVPVGTKDIDDLRDTLMVGVTDPSQVRVSPPVGAGGAGNPEGPVLLVARLGADTRRQLDASHRTFSAANSQFVGVVAVDGHA